MLLALYAAQLVGELELLTARIKTLKPGENYRKGLKYVIDRHCELIKMHHILEDIYGFSILWITVTSAIGLCMVVHQASHVGITTFLRPLEHMSKIIKKILIFFQR